MCNINTGVHARAQSRRVTQRSHDSPRWETGLQSANDVTQWKRAEDFGRFWKSQLVELRPASGKTVGFRLLAVALDWSRTRWGQMKKPEEKEYASVSLCWRNFKLKGNKKFRAWTKKSCFSCFEIPMFYLYGHSMYVSHIAISLPWYIIRNNNTNIHQRLVLIFY